MYRVITPTEIEVVSVEEFKQFMRIDFDETDDDVLMEMLIESAIEFCESYTGRSIALKTYEKVYRGLVYSPTIEVRKGDLTEIVSLTKKNSSGDDLDYEVSDLEFFNYGQSSDISLSNQSSNISTGTHQTRPLVLVFKSGWIDTNIPKNMKNAILKLTAHWYENRENIKLEELTDIAETPYGVTTILERYKYRRM